MTDAERKGPQLVATFQRDCGDGKVGEKTFSAPLGVVLYTMGFTIGVVQNAY
jgi:hypothetical protein